MRASIPNHSGPVGELFTCSISDRRCCNPSQSNNTKHPNHFSPPKFGFATVALEGGLSPQPPVSRPSGLRVTDDLSPVFMGPDGKLLQTRRDISNAIDIAEAELGTTCGVLAGGAWADWWFIPYAYQWTSNHQKLSGAAKQVVGLDPSNAGFYRRLKKELRTKSGIKRVKSIYDSLNSNATSLSIYAGPIRENSGRSVYGSTQNAETSGWLLTGDAKLKTKSRMAEWKHFFESMAPTTGHLMLPHHGAAENFNPNLVTFAKHARNFVTVNSDDFDKEKRPPFKVVSQLGGNLRAVSELTASCVAEVSGPWQCNDAYWLNKISGW